MSAPPRWSRALEHGSEPGPGRVERGEVRPAGAGDPARPSAAARLHRCWAGARRNNAHARGAVAPGGSLFTLVQNG